MSTSEKAGLSQQTESVCDYCGYSRRGIPREARCPECGEVPTIVPVADVIEQYRSAGHIYWLRAVAVGLVLLMGAWAVSLVVMLYMPLGSFTLAGVSFPGPKIQTTTLLNRPMSDVPNSWGAVGAMTVLAELAGVWLLTERQSMRGDNEPFWNLRRVTRWTAVICVGGMLGRMLGYDADIDNEWAKRLNLWISLAVGEFPANLMLYLYLRQLARRLDVRRAMRAFDVSAWAVPIVIAASIAVVFAEPFSDDMPYRGWRIICGVFGIGATSVGIVAFGAVSNLTVAVVWTAFGGWMKNSTKSRC
jgi:hypothetical protein